MPRSMSSRKKRTKKMMELLSLSRSIDQVNFQLIKYYFHLLHSICKKFKYMKEEFQDIIMKIFQLKMKQEIEKLNFNINQIWE
jgi:hypothetical protein